MSYSDFLFLPVGETKVNHILLLLEAKHYKLTAGNAFSKFSPKFALSIAKNETDLPQDQVTVVNEIGFKNFVIF